MAKKNTLVKKEKARLMEIFKDIDSNKYNFVMTLIDRLAWLNVSVKEIEKSIDEKGTTIPYDNGGGQKGIRDNPDVKNYIKEIAKRWGGCSDNNVVQNMDKLKVRVQKFASDNGFEIKGNQFVVIK